MNFIEKSEQLSDKFDFVCCWTCKNGIFDLDKRAHECKLSGKTIKSIHSPVACTHWTQG